MECSFGYIVIWMTGDSDETAFEGTGEMLVAPHRPYMPPSSPLQLFYVVAILHTMSSMRGKLYQIRCLLQDQSRRQRVLA